MRSNAAAMLLADYRSLGAPDLVCVSDRGEGRGYILKRTLLKFYHFRKGKSIYQIRIKENILLKHKADKTVDIFSKKMLFHASE